MVAQSCKVVVRDAEGVLSEPLVEDRDAQKVQVVVDLFPDQDYDLQQVFLRKYNLFVLIINELISQKVE